MNVGIVKEIRGIGKRETMEYEGGVRRGSTKGEYEGGVRRGSTKGEYEGGVQGNRYGGF